MNILVCVLQLIFKITPVFSVVLNMTMENLHSVLAVHIMWYDLFSTSVSLPNVTWWILSLLIPLMKSISPEIPLSDDSFHSKFLLLLFFAVSHLPQWFSFIKINNPLTAFLLDTFTCFLKQVKYVCFGNILNSCASFVFLIHHSEKNTRTWMSSTVHLLNLIWVDQCF